MINAHVNILAVIACVVVAMIVGMIWYHPKVFGNKWMALLGKDKSQMKADSKLYVYTIILAFITAISMAWFISVTGATVITDGLRVGLLAWLGFAFATTGVNYLFEMRSYKLLMLTEGYHLVNFLLISAILVSWK